MERRLRIFRQTENIHISEGPDFTLSLHLWVFRQLEPNPLVPLSQIRRINDPNETISLAHQLEPDDFFRSTHPHVLQNIENRLVWQIGFSARYEDRSILSENDASNLAKEHLKNFLFVGRVDSLESDACTLFKLLGFENYRYMQVLNPTRSPVRMSDLSSKTRLLLERLTDLDRKPYDDF